jgi:glutamyl-tRNA synthetase
MSIRTRFAPSPTGQVHIGNIRVAIYNWLMARHAGGKFLLRIEDTDRERSTPEACRTVLDTLAWLGLDADEEPVYQSARRDAHLAAAETLLSEGKAYKEDKGGTGQGEAVVFRMPGSDMAFHDEVKGDLAKKAEDMKDLVIVRSNGTPVFHLANVVDDIDMGVTHVIRGDDHVENTYRHLALYHALGAPPPRFAHLPMIVNHQGKPYSKRDGDAYVGEYRDKGFLPDTVLNYLALLGWSPGDDREVMTREEMIELFALDRVQSSPAQMDPQKMAWLNGEHMRRLPPADYAAGIRRDLEHTGLVDAGTDPDYLQAVVAVMGDRIKLWTDATDQAGFFFTEDFAYDEKAVKKRLLKEGAMENLALLRERFAAAEPFNAETLEAALRTLAEEQSLGAGSLIHPLRIAVSGIPAGPSLFDMLVVLGRDRVLQRIDRTLLRFKGVAG